MIVRGFLQVDSLGWGSKTTVKCALEFFPSLFFCDYGPPKDGLCIPMNSVSPLSLWQDIISGEGEAAEERELGIL